MKKYIFKWTLLMAAVFLCATKSFSQTDCIRSLSFSPANPTIPATGGQLTVVVNFSGTGSRNLSDYSLRVLLHNRNMVAYTISGVNNIIVTIPPNTGEAYPAAQLYINIFAGPNTVPCSYTQVLTFNYLGGAVIGAISPSDENYIISSTPYQAFTATGVSTRDTAKVITNIVYYDGLGRPMQEVAVRGAATNKDLVRPILYDAYGREDKTYLPYERSGTIGVFTANATAVSAQAAAYKSQYNTNDGTYAYSETAFDNSPLNRVTKQSIPGYTHRIAGTQHNRLAYTVNTANEVKLWKMTGDVLSQSGNYAAGELYVNESTDPAGLTVREFTDKLGNVVEKWQVSSGGTLKTSYVYDTYNRLRVVIPPKAQSLTVNSAAFNKLVYRYTYDARGRMIEKQLPDTDGPQYFVYDSRDRLVLFQDALLRSTSQWKQTLYDNLNRPVAEGMITSTVTHATFRSYFANSAVNQTRTNATYTFTTVAGVPALTANTVLAYTYYDTYDGCPLTYSEPVFGATAPPRLITAKGQFIWKKEKVLDGNELTASAKWLSTANFYDGKYRQMQIKRDLFDGTTVGKSTISSDFMFDGKPSYVEENQVFNGVSTTMYITYGYDHLRRPFIIKVNNVPVANYSYDATGRMKTKILGNNIQTVNYAYDIRDWLTSTSSAKFNSTLTYKADGNIEKQVSANNGTSLTYNYTYDGFGRLLSGMAGTTGENAITYDNNGNIMTLTRGGSHHNGTYTYTYDGNRLTNLKKGAGNYTYTYDANGNTTTDGLRGMTIAYNFLNLPKKISKGSDNVEYIYSVTGEKLAKKKNGAFTQFYCGSMVYKADKSLEYVMHPEGLAQRNGTLYDYQYNLTDHLGNVRSVLAANGTVLQANDYYPFGLTHISTPSIANIAKNKYLYNGKEIQNDVLAGTVIDFLDYGARLYDATIGRWHTIDPLAEQNRRFSPFVYCANNPLRFIDPNGMYFDNYQIDRNGNILIDDPEKTNDNYDVLYATNKQTGEIDKSTSIQVEKGVIDSYTRAGTKSNSYDYMTVNGDKNGQAVFEFVANNSDVEWSQVKVGDVNYISTSHNPRSDNSGGLIIRNLLKVLDIVNNLYGTKLSVDEQIHSHPKSTLGPSGFETKNPYGDKVFGEWINKHTPNTTLKVYEVKTGKYINYNHEKIFK